MTENIAAKPLKNEDTLIEQPGQATEICKSYKRRWFILFLFCLCSACNASHWIQYSIIANIVQKYYKVSTTVIDWTSIIFMAAYIPLVFPASWVLQKKGLRVAVILGAFLLAIGSWVKVFSYEQDKFHIGFIGQTIVGISQMFTLGAPAHLAAIWFPHHQLSTATSIGVFGNQLGIAIGFVLPPIIVHYREGDTEITGKELLSLHIGTAVAATVILLLIYLFFQAGPPEAPSMAQKLVQDSKNMKEKTYFESLKILFTNKDFNVLLLSYGMNIGAFYAYSTLLNQLIIKHFKNSEEDAGCIGLILIVGGIFGSLAWGIVLDKTRIYKGTTVAIYILSTLGMAAFTCVLELNSMVFIYVTSAFLGFFMNGYLAVGYEFAVELTYPESESASSGLLNASGELCGVIAVIITGEIVNTYGTLTTNLSLVGMLFFGLVLCIFIDGTKLRRLAAGCQKMNQNNEEKMEMLQI